MDFSACSTSSPLQQHGLSSRLLTICLHHQPLDPEANQVRINNFSAWDSKLMQRRAERLANLKDAVMKQQLTSGSEASTGRNGETQKVASSGQNPDIQNSGGGGSDRFLSADVSSGPVQYFPGPWYRNPIPQGSGGNYFLPLKPANNAQKFFLVPQFGTDDQDTQCTFCREQEDTGVADDDRNRRFLEAPAPDYEFPSSLMPQFPRAHIFQMLSKRVPSFDPKRVRIPVSLRRDAGIGRYFEASRG
jgi:hypothetical protein